MKSAHLRLHLLVCGTLVACSGANSGTASDSSAGGHTTTSQASGGASALGGMTASAGSSTGAATAATGGLNATGGTSSASGTKSTGGSGNTGGSTSAPVGGTTANATGGATSKATGGAPSATGGAQTGGSSATATGGVTSTGGTKATGGNATGGRTNTGGTASATGGSSAAGGGASSCGSGTLNPNPFGCSFAWGVSDPPTDLSAYGFLQFITYWVDYGIAADGTFSTCNGCNWLKKFATTNIIPVYYAYIIGYYAHANNIVDGNQCPASNPNCPNLTNDGAAFVKAHRSTIIQAYANYAKQSYAAWPTKPLVWLLEGDFVQFADSGQSSPFTMTEVAQLAADITCAIKGNMPNAVVGINHSTWNSNDVTNSYWGAMKSVGVKHDFAWTTGIAANGFFNTGVTSSTYNGSTATYAYLHQVSGKKIFVDDGCGANAAEDWAPASASTLNARIASGVMAFGHCGSLEANYQSQITALTSQLNSTCN